MAIVRESFNSQANTTATTTPTVNAPTGVTSGDVLVCAIGFNGSPGTITPPADWQLVGWEIGASNPRIGLWYKVAGSSEPSSYQWSHTTSVASGMAIARYSGVDNTTPSDVTAVSSYSAATVSTFDLTGVTTNTDGAMVISCFALNSSSTTITVDSTLVSEVVEVLGKKTELDDGVKATAGATGVINYDLGGARACAGIVWALKPASGGGTTHDGAASLASTSTKTAVGRLTFDASATLASSSTKTTLGTLFRNAIIVLTAIATLTATAVGVVTHDASASLDSTSTNVPVATVYKNSQATLSGSSTITVAGIAYKNATTTITATSTLTSGGGVIIPATTSLAGSSTLIPTATVMGGSSMPYAMGISENYLGATVLGGIYPSQAANGVAILSASSNMTAQGGLLVQATATLSTASTLTASPTIYINGTTTLAGSGVLTAVAKPTYSASATLAGSSSLTATAVGYTNAEATLISSSALTPAGSVIIPFSASLVNTSSLTVVGIRYIEGSSTLGGTSSLISSVGIIIPASSTLSASSTIVSDGTIITYVDADAVVGASSNLFANGYCGYVLEDLTLSAHAGVPLTHEGSATLSSTSTLTVVGVRYLDSLATISASTTLTVSGNVVYSGQATLAATSDADVKTIGYVNASSALGATSDLTVAGGITTLGDTTLTSTSDMLTAGVVYKEGVCTLDGSTSLIPVGRVTYNGITTLVSTSDLSVDAVGYVNALASLQASSDLSVVGGRIVSGISALSTTSDSSVNGGIVYSASTTLGATSSLTTVIYTSGSATLGATSQLFAAGYSGYVLENLTLVAFGTENAFVEADVTLSGSSALTVAGIRKAWGASANTASATVSAVADITLGGQATLGGSSTLVVVGKVAINATSALGASSTLSVVADSTPPPIITIAKALGEDYVGATVLGGIYPSTALVTNATLSAGSTLTVETIVDSISNFATFAATSTLTADAFTYDYLPAYASLHATSSLFVENAPSFVGAPYTIYSNPGGSGKNLIIRVSGFVADSLLWSVDSQSGCGDASFALTNTSGEGVYVNTLSFTPNTIWEVPNEITISVFDGVTTITTTVYIRLNYTIFFPIRSLPVDTYSIFLTDSLFNKKAIIDYYTSAEFITRFNDIGTFNIDMNMDDAGQIGWSADEAEPFSHLLVERNGTAFFTGTINEVRRALDFERDGITISGTDAMKLLQDRVALPVYNRGSTTDAGHTGGVIPDYTSKVYDIQPVPSITGYDYVGTPDNYGGSIVTIAAGGSDVGTTIRTYRVWISTASTVSTKAEKFSWSVTVDAVTTRSEKEIDVTGDAQLIDNGAVSIKFASTYNLNGGVVGSESDKYWTFNYQGAVAPAETVIKNYVINNMGTGALSYRQIAGLTVETSLGRGTNIRGRARFDNLLELLKKLALRDPSNELRFFFEKGNPNGLVFKMSPVVDKTSTIVLSKDLGTIKSFEYTLQASSGNYAYVGGKGSDASRQVYELISNESNNVAKYGLIEKFIDSSSGETTEDLYAAAITELAKTQDQTKIEIVPAPIPNMTIIDDYWVGDKVSAIVDGSEFQEVIREISVKISRDGGVVTTPVIGTPEQRHTTLLDLFNKSRKVSERVSALERR